ncbi:MAG: TonB-dependent receptor domain-containing protein [Acidobacteriota bacterium]
MGQKSCVVIRLTVSLFFIFGVTATAHAQFRASIQGTVTDTSGAVIPGVSVTVTNQETGLSQEVITTDEGVYRVSALPPGRYTVSAQLEGFKKRVIENVVVSAEEPRGVNLILEVGEVSEVVTVTATAGLTQTENADVSGTLATVEIQRLPQLGRDPYELIRLAPGVFGLGARSAGGGSVGFPNQAGPGGSNDSIFQTENQVPISANGQRVEANNFQIDGVTTMSQAWGGAAVITPNQESVKEIRVVANNYSAEYGRNTGAQVLVVSQAGTNQFHGSGVFKRNTAGLNAFQKWGGPFLRPQRVSQFLSQWAGSVGGPILQNKLFFFFSYETLRRAKDSFFTDWVETPEFVDLVKSQRPNSIAAKIFSFPGVTPARIAKTLERRDIGSLTGGPGQVVAGGDSSLGGGLDGIPDIQRAEIATFNNTVAQQFNARVDYQLTEKDLVAFSMYFVPNTRESNNAWANDGRPYGDFTSARRNTVGTLLWTRTLSPTLLNEARFNVTRWFFDEIESNPTMPWGIPKVRVTFPGSVLRTLGPNVGPGVFFQTTYNFRNTLSKVVNAHALKFGADVIREQNNSRAPWAGRPSYWFGNLWSFANDAPREQVAFLEPKTGAFTDLARYPRSDYYALFVQDDWKVRPNLTLNLGLRWEYFTPLRTKRGNLANLILGPNGELTGARITLASELSEPDRNNFGPQLGFAWSPAAFKNKVVLRGGFGVGFNRLPGSRLLESQFNPPDFNGFNLFGEDIHYALASDLNTFGFPPTPAATRTFDPNTNLPVSGKVGINQATAQKIPTPYAYRYSLTAESEVRADWLVSLGYQGSAAHKLPRVVPHHLFVAPNPSIERVNLMRTDVNSNYNALLARLTRPFAAGYLLNAEYRWSKSLDTCSSDHNCVQSFPFDQRTEYGPSDFDVTHSFRAWGTWDLPLFRGRNGALGKVAGGWELTGILTASSGFPWTPVFGGSECQVEVAGGRVCPLRPIAQIQAATDDTSNQIFMRPGGAFPGGGLKFFTPPPKGTFGVPPRPGIGRNSFRGPHYFAVDLTVVKRFSLPGMAFLGEGASLEIRANAFNLFNNLNLGPFGFNSRSTQIDNADFFGRAENALAGRVVEFQARFSF